MIIPWILFARMRARNKGRTAKLACLLAVTATAFCFILIIPTTATAQWTGQSEFGSSLKQGHKKKWGFSHSDDDSSPTTWVLYYPGPSTSKKRLGYWFASAPWLGFASEEVLFPSDVEGMKSSRDEDTGLFPLTGLLMFRYPIGGFQPYIGIGPSIMSSGDGLQQIDILDSVFLGFSYTF